MVDHSKDKYAFLAALRPFSFPVALIACGTGISLAWVEGYQSLGSMLAIFLGGLLLQAGVNLINDYSDLTQVQSLTHAQQSAIRRNFKAGLGCFAVATLIGLGFVYQVGLAFALLCVVGLVGALGYTLQPVNYKSRGLGVVLVFWLMGVLMISGSYVAMGGLLSAQVIWLSIPVSLLVSQLLLSNELRDFEADKRLNIHTLVVKMGYQNGVKLYQFLLAAVALSVLILAVVFQSVGLLLALLSFILVPSLLKLLNQPAEARRPLTPSTGRLLMVFGVLFNTGILFSLNG